MASCIIFNICFPSLSTYRAPAATYVCIHSLRSGKGVDSVPQPLLGYNHVSAVSSMVCRRRENADYRRLGPCGGGFNAAGYDEMLARLIVDQPGVHHRCVADAAAAADHISYLTKALAQQPFKAQARRCAYIGSRLFRISYLPQNLRHDHLLTWTVLHILVPPCCTFIACRCFIANVSSFHSSALSCRDSLEVHVS